MRWNAFLNCRDGSGLLSLLYQSKDLLGQRYYMQQIDYFSKN